jgi:hypothetical protein
LPEFQRRFWRIAGEIARNLLAEPASDGRPRIGDKGIEPKRRGVSVRANTRQRGDLTERTGRTHPSTALAFSRSDVSPD